jgi:hypothetical protein
LEIAEAQSNLEVKHLSLSEVFSSTYRVPGYQRKYDWKESEVQLMCSDFLEFYQSGSPAYQLGQITVAKSSGVNYSIIDGQQRLSTLTLLFAVLYRSMDTGLGLPALSSNSTLNCLQDEGEIRVLMSGKAHNVVLEYAFNNTPISDIRTENVSQELVLDALSIIEEYFTKAGILTDEVHLKAFAKLVRTGVFLTRQSHSTESDANDIYDRLNNRGLQVAPSDRLKNRLFEKLSDAEFDAATDVWEAAENTLHSVKSDMQTLLIYIYKSRTGEPIQDKDVFVKWSSLLTTPEERSRFVLDIECKSKILKGMLQDAPVCPSGILDLYSYGTAHLKYKQNYPLKLAGSHLDQDSYELLAKRLESIAILWLIAGRGPNTYASLTMKWSQEIASLPSNATADQIKLATDLPDSEIQKLFVEAADKLGGMRYGLLPRHTNRLRYVLARTAYEINKEMPVVNFTLKAFLETLTTKSEKNAASAFPGFDIDHIDPASTSILGEKKDSLGNLALLHYRDNRSKKNSTPLTKSDVYESSHVFLTKALSSTVPTDSKLAALLAPYQVSVVDSGPWDLASVERRHEMYCDILFTALAKDLG